MSSPAQGGASTAGEPKEKKGIGKVLSRVKTVLRRGDGSSSKRQSQAISAPKPAATTSAAAATTKTETTTPKKPYVSDSPHAIQVPPRHGIQPEHD